MTWWLCFISCIQEKLGAWPMSSWTNFLEIVWESAVVTGLKLPRPFDHKLTLPDSCPGEGAAILLQRVLQVKMRTQVVRKLSMSPWFQSSVSQDWSIVPSADRIGLCLIQLMTSVVCLTRLSDRVYLNLYETFKQPSLYFFGNSIGLKLSCGIFI